jgi:phospholipase/carboxylesterase
MDRRQFLHTAVASAAPFVAGCDDLLSRGVSVEQATLLSRPSAPTRGVAHGYQELGLSSVRDGLLYVPPSYDPATPTPLLVLLHGGGQNSDEWKTIKIENFVDPHAVIVLAPSSRGSTWELLSARPYGDDARFIDEALAHTFERCNIHPDRIGLGGFSDGASEAVSLGVTNGNFFRELLIMSPGRLDAVLMRGRPRVYLSHGIDDDVLPVGNSRNRVRPTLVENGYTVIYNEFAGGHAMHGPTMRAAISWLETA